VAALLGAALAVACGGAGDVGRVEDPNAIFDAFPLYPGTDLDGAPAPPAGLVGGDIHHFDDDRRFFVAGPNPTQGSVLAFYSEEVPQLGWEVEDPVKPRIEEMKNYCPKMALSDATAGTPLGSFVTCLGFVKDDVRMIISVPIQLQLNPIAAQGVSYHVHLEPR
jgi:hypothetical protein